MSKRKEIWRLTDMAYKVREIADEVPLTGWCDQCEEPVSMEYEGTAGIMECIASDLERMAWDLYFGRTS